MTGNVQLLGGTTFDNVGQGQTIKSGESHTSEVVAASTCTHRLIPNRGLIQECHIPQSAATAIFLDSMTTIYVANNDTAAAKSLWLRRRVDILHTHQENGAVVYNKVAEEFNPADVYTKYLTYDRWKRHMKVILNATDEQWKNTPPVSLTSPTVDDKTAPRPEWAKSYTRLQAKAELARLEYEYSTPHNDVAMSHLASRGDTLRSIVAGAM